MDIFSFLLGAGLGIVTISSLGFIILRERLKPAEPVTYIDYYPADHVVVTVYVIEDANTQYPVGRWFDLPISWQLMVKVARKVVSDNYNFSYSLTGKEAGNPLSRAEFDNLRSLFLEKGLICYRVPSAHRKGLQLTAAGKAYFKQWATSPPQPSMAMGEWDKRQVQTNTNTISNT